MAIAVAVVLIASAGASRADKLDVLRRYEEALVQSALEKTGLVIDPAPDGKIIERVVIVANKVILPGDLPLAGKIPWTWLNHLHVRTRDYVIAREMLFHVGEPLRADLIEESGRNLRQFFILAVARIVVAHGSAPDRVVVSGSGATLGRSVCARHPALSALPLTSLSERLGPDLSEAACAYAVALLAAQEPCDER